MALPLVLPIGWHCLFDGIPDVIAGIDDGIAEWKWTADGIAAGSAD